MGGSASKAGAAAGRALRVSTPKVNSASAGRTGVAGGGSSPLPHFPQDDAAVKNFKPTKVVEMSREDARAAATTMYVDRVPEMDPEVLKAFMKMGPAVKSELNHQKLIPDESERVEVTTPRPLPRSRARHVISSNEVAAHEGVLTQTQALELLAVRETEHTPEATKSMASKFDVSEEDVRVLLKYCRAPDVRKVNGELLARWYWREGEGEQMTAGASNAS